MLHFERLMIRLLDSDLSWGRKNHIMSARWPTQNLMLHGLPKNTIKRVLDDVEPVIFKGTLRTPVADLRSHHLTRKYRDPKYASENRTLVALEASRVLREERYEMVGSNDERIIPFPGCTKGKQNTVARGPRQTIKHGPSMLSREIDVKDMEDVSEEDYEEMQAFYRELCETFDGDPKKADSNNDIYLNRSTDDEVESDVEVTGSSTAEPDDYDLEMAKAEEEGLFEALREQEQTSGMPTSGCVNIEVTGIETKRKWDSAVPPEIPAVDTPDLVEHDQKRSKLETSTKSFQVSSPRRQKKARRKGRGNLESHRLFSRSSSLAAVFEAAIAVGALEAHREGSSNDHELDAVDLELLGEDPSDSKQTQSSVHEDIKVFLGEALYPLVSHDDLRVAYAAANLIEIHAGNSKVSELEQVDRKALREAFGSPREDTS